MTVETYDPERHAPVFAVDLNSVRDGLVGSLCAPGHLEEVLGADDRVWALDEDDDVWSARIMRVRHDVNKAHDAWVELRLEDW